MKDLKKVDTMQDVQTNATTEIHPPTHDDDDGAQAGIKETCSICLRSGISPSSSSEELLMLPLSVRFSFLAFFLPLPLGPG